MAQPAARPTQQSRAEARVQIERVATRRQRDSFLTLPDRIYAGDPNYVAPLLMERRDFLDPAKNPFFKHASTELFLARKDGEVVGFALFFHSFSTFLGKPGIYLEDLYVRPKYRGFGCGAALLRHLARLAVERKCGRLEWSVLDWNQRAIDFYKSLGAEPLDEWTMYRVTGEALRRLAQCKV